MARLAVLVLLAWTAIDLAYPKCCLDERLLNAAAVSAATPNESSTPPEADDEDCLCCARCVDTSARPLELDLLTARTSFIEPVQHPTSRSSSLDHPPQNA